MFEESMRDTDTNCIATQGWCGCVLHLYVYIFFLCFENDTYNQNRYALLNLFRDTVKLIFVIEIGFT